MLSESEARDAIIVALDCDRRRALFLAEALEGHEDVCGRAAGVALEELLARS